MASAEDEIVRDTLESVRRWPLQLTDEQKTALRIRAEQEGRPVDELVSEAIGVHIERHRRQRISRAIETVRTEDADLLNRLEE